jgi:hypothetical protein
MRPKPPHFHPKTACPDLPGARFIQCAADWQSAVSPVVNRRGDRLFRIPPVSQERTAITLEMFISSHWSFSPIGPPQAAVRLSRLNLRPLRARRATFDSSSKLLFPDFCPQENIFFEERTQTLPVIIDDREKTNPKRTQTGAKRTQK